MKNYKMLVPIVLVAFMCLSVYQLYSSTMEQNQEYKQALKNAEYCSLHGLVDAPEHYETALEINKTINTYSDYVKYYISLENYKDAIDVAERMKNDFPKNSEAYDLLMSIYEKTKDYSELFNIYDETVSKNINSASIDEIYEANEFEFYDYNKRYTSVKDQTEGYYAICNEKGLWGYASASGSRVVDCKYKYAGGFSSGMAPVIDENDNLYYINSEGGKKFIFDSQENYDYLGMMVNGMYVVGYNGKYAYYNTEFKKLHGDYDYAGTYNNGTAAVKKGSDWYLIDESGKIISDKYSKIITDENDIACKNERVVAFKDGEYYLLNAKGRVVLKTDFDDIAIIDSDNLIAYKKGEKWGFCNLNGVTVIKPQYDNAKSFSNGLAPVCMNNKWGYITEKGNVVIDYQFAEAYGFNAQGNAIVSEDEDMELTVIKLYKFNHS